MLQVGKPVTGKNLIGRENELKLIEQLLLGGQSVVIIAPRRFGKTSLVLELLNRLGKEKLFTCYTDIFSTPSINELAVRITENVLANRKFDQAFRKMRHNIAEVLRNVKFRQEIEDFSFILEYQKAESATQWELLEKSLSFIDHYTAKHQKKMIAAFDEFGDINKLDGEEIVKMFRAKIQRQEHVSYIFCGSYESVMDQLFVSAKSPFYRLARIIRLGSIEETIFKKYIKKELTARQLSFTDERIDEILDFTRGHPYYTQLYLQECVLIALLGNLSDIPGHSVIVNQLLVTEKNYLEKNWEDLAAGKEERKIIMAVADNTASLYSRLNNQGINVARGLKKLKGKGVLHLENKAYRLTDPLFNEWIKQNILRK